MFPTCNRLPVIKTKITVTRIGVTPEVIKTQVIDILTTIHITVIITSLANGIGRYSWRVTTTLPIVFIRAGGCVSGDRGGFVNKID